jgi:cell division control protein 24
MRELQIQEILTPDTVHYLFGNLNSLVDFQRRFLIHLEEIAEKSAQEQNFGSLFSQLEDQFTVYEPYCSNYFSAQDLVTQEAPKLQKLADILNPVYELPSMLIKPVQRICKYPLLMQQLIKSTNSDWPHVAEMEEGLEAIKRVTEKVNETQRKHENMQVVESLKSRLDELRGSNIDSFGSLLLQDKLILTSVDDTEKELQVFFFEKTLLICKENKDKGKSAKNTISIKKKRRASLQPRGLIFTNRILAVHNRTENGVWSLAIEWRDREVDRIHIRFRNEEQIKLWESTLRRVMTPIKTTVSNTQLASMKSPTMPTSVPEFLRVDEDDESDQTDDEDAYQRSRSNSMSAHLLNTISGRPKIPRNMSADPAPGFNNGSKTPRSYQTMPLPRSSSSTNTLSQDYYYPASPPPSNPSSPTSSSRASQSSARQRDGSPLADIGSKFMASDTEDYRQFPLPPHMSRSQSTSYNNTFQSNRLRSQSSPNIHKWEERNMQQPPSPLEQHSNVKIKLNYNDGIYVILCPLEVTFIELMDKVDKKIRLVSHLKSDDILRLKYQDEDGDLITINSDEDVQMAFESRSNAVNLFITV